MATKQELKRQLSRLDEQIVSWGEEAGRYHAAGDFLMGERVSIAVAKKLRQREYVERAYNNATA